MKWESAFHMMIKWMKKEKKRRANKKYRKINQREVIALFLSICDLLKEWLAISFFSLFFFHWKHFVWILCHVIERKEGRKDEYSWAISLSYLKFIYKNILFHFISVIPLEIKKGNVKHDNQQNQRKFLSLSYQRHIIIPFDCLPLYRNFFFLFIFFSSTFLERF